MNFFLICPVREASQATKMIIDEWVEEMELLDHKVHYPGRDTKQDDPIGYQICTDNKNAMTAADRVAIIWDGKSTGCLFDIGMAFAMDKQITVVSIPESTEGKSFQNMILEWKRRQEIRRKA
jgi:hypothetical protein